jgi:hypothetical protein
MRRTLNSSPTGPRLEALGARSSRRGSDAPAGLRHFVIHGLGAVQSILFIVSIKEFSFFLSLPDFPLTRRHNAIKSCWQVECRGS